MAAFLGVGLFSFLGSLLARFFASSVARTIAMKVILTTLIVTVLPIVLNNFIYGLIEKILAFASQTTGAHEVRAQVASFTGLTAYFASLLKIPECFAITMTALSIKVTFRMIPFIKLVN